MLLRITYFNTKRFFKSSIESFKSYFPRGYQRLPKTPPCNPFSCTGSRSGVIPYTNHFNRHYKEPNNNNTTNNHANVSNTSKEPSSILELNELNLIINHNEVDSKKQENNKIDSGNKHEKNHDQGESSKCLVTRKLKELEMMDGNNLDLVHDIEEVLHYYSRLTCPVYRDIIEKFFVDLYSGTFNLSGVDNSVLKKMTILN